MGEIIKFAASPLLAILDKPKVPKTPIVPPAATPRKNATAVEDALSRRSGTRANQRSGLGGSEARQGTKSKLGQ